MMGRVSAAIAAGLGLRRWTRSLRNLQRRVDSLEFLVGQLHAARVAGLEEAHDLSEVEFGVYSQWGEDGILEYLFSRVDVPNPVFVEFGVEDYTEANTRFLLRRRNWIGLVMDASASNIARIRADPLHEHHDLAAVRAVVNAENVNQLIGGQGFSGDIGLLSIDVDGNDYWIWRAIDVVSPRVVVCEYNSVFGDSHAVTVPYDPQFQRTAAHYSKLFFGASLPALRELAAEKGYVFVGCNTAGVNAFFVRADCAGPFAALAANARYVKSRFRESVDRSGRRTFLSGVRRLTEIGDCTVYDVRAGRELRVAELAGPGSP
jgi:hypothetical protein